MRIKKTIFLIFFFLIMINPVFALSSGGKNYASVSLDGSVNSITSEFIINAIETANKDSLQFVVIKMDTPGGLMEPMRDIIKSILSSGIPVVVYAYPKGARAASAGGYIMLAAHIAAMAPGTEIGAMHPVSPLLNFDKKGEGNGTGIMEKKVLNDTLAYARSLAQKRNRNMNWVEEAVVNAASSTYLEAKRLGVIDITAEDMNDLLRQLNGRSVDVNGRIVRLNTEESAEIAFEMDWKKKFFNFFADPQIVLFLFIIAAIGIAFEIKSPGMVFPGVIGVLSLFLFIMSMRILPVNFMGLAFVILAVALFILELKITSYGFLTAGGIISFIFGSLMLFDSSLPGMSIPLSSVIAAAVIILLFFFVIVRSVVSAHRGKVTTGKNGMIGQTGTAIEDFDGKGKILLRGEYWNAVSGDRILKNDPVVVDEVNGLTLAVRKKA